MKIDPSKQTSPSTADFIRMAESKLGSCIQTVFGKQLRFLVTSALLDETDSTIKVDFTLPCQFGNKHFVWHFSVPALTKEFCQNGPDSK